VRRPQSQPRADMRAQAAKAGEVTTKSWSD
jgi:hypothetical protein